MKKSILTIALLAVTVMASAQKYEPNTKWPYLYQDFTTGTIYFEGNQKYSNRKLNIHLLGNKLHYLGEDGRIYQSDDQKVTRVEICADAYIFSNHKLVRIVTAEGTNLLVMLTKANFDALQQSSGAYGASLNSSASCDLSSLDLGGLDKPELGKMLQEKNEGRTIPIENEYFFIIDGKEVNASKKAVEKIIDRERTEEWKLFLKENKLKWKKVESLKLVLGFISK